MYVKVDPETEYAVLLMRIPFTYILTLLFADGGCVKVKIVCEAVAVNSSATSITGAATVGVTQLATPDALVVKTCPAVVLCEFG